MRSSWPDISVIATVNSVVDLRVNWNPSFASFFSVFCFSAKWRHPVARYSGDSAPTLWMSREASISRWAFFGQHFQILKMNVIIKFSTEWLRNSPLRIRKNHMLSMWIICWGMCEITLCGYVPWNPNLIWPKRIRKWKYIMGLLDLHSPILLEIKPWSSQLINSRPPVETVVAASASWSSMQKPTKIANLFVNTLKTAKYGPGPRATNVNSL